MAKKIEDMNDRQLRVEIHHTNDPARIEAAEKRLKEITSAKNQGTLKGILNTATKRKAELKAATDASSSGRGNSAGRGKPSGGNTPSGKDRWPESRLRRAMRDEGDPEAYAILKGRNRVNGADQRKYDEARNKNTRAASDTPRISPWERRRLKKNAAAGDKQSFEKLQQAGELTSDIEQRYKNTSARSSGGWVDRTSSSRRPQGSQEERWIAEMQRNVTDPDQRKFAEERARVTFEDLRKSGYSDEVIGEVLDQYKGKFDLSRERQAGRQLRAKLEEEERRRRNEEGDQRRGR
ncbi:MAG TPA: hypothetical protein VFT64_01790 [Rickettsiales bacterium]|nr:hypothetical protein [Rickettsiales bacterium]